MKKLKLTWLNTPLLLIALTLSIPAFYLVLVGADAMYRSAGSWLYGLVAVLLLVHRLARRKIGRWARSVDEPRVDLLILVGSLASAWPRDYPFGATEWILRLCFCGVVFIRLAGLLSKYVTPNRLVQTLGVAALTLAAAGAGFYMLEPRVHSYADGVWLAFITGATVGYGDLVPSTPASRIFAAFIVLLGYALFSIVTASISALFVGEDEKHQQREMHADMRSLRREIAELRAELRESYAASGTARRAGDVKDPQ